MATILVVDDEATTRNGLSRLLRHEGYDVLGAGNGREALDVLGASGPAAGPEAPPAPDLVLLDLMMPELDGLELLEILHGDPRWKQLPVVVLTGMSDVHTIRRADQLGAKEYMVKASFSIADMLGHVRKYTGGNGQAGPTHS
jgi:CheY-like chemotaxis protein